MMLVATLISAPLLFEEIQAQSTTVADTRTDSINQLLRDIVDVLIRDNVKNWNPQRIRLISDNTIMLAIEFLDWDRPDFSRQILPDGITLEQFDRMLNREISRRGMWGYIYANDAAHSAGLPDLPPSTGIQAMDFTRPNFSFPAGYSGQSERVRMEPRVVAIYDSGVDTLINNTSGFALRSDTARAMGLPPRVGGRAYGSTSGTDVADKRRLYALGAQAEFNPSNPNAQLPLPITTGQAADQVQISYCGLIARIYESGRSLDPRDAGLTGAIEGRVDARNGFEPREANFGITGPCHP